jgi:pimeloyl-ACP methyl ester carboxylesterase
MHGPRATEQERHPMKSPLLPALALLALAAPVFAANESGTSAKGVPYSIRVPDGYDPAKPGILVVDIHSEILGGEKTQFTYQLEMAEWLQSAVILAPHGTKTEKNGESWSEDGILELVRETRAKHKTLRTIVFGRDLGTLGAALLSFHHPEAVDAYICYSALFEALENLPSPAPGAFSMPIYIVAGASSSRVAQAREGAKKLQGQGFKQLKYDEIPGDGVSVDEAVLKRAFDWIEAALGPARPPKPKLSEADANEKIAAVEKAVKEKDFAAAAEALSALETAPSKLSAKVAALAKTHAASSEEPLALAAVELAATLKEAGLPALKGALKSKAKPVALAAAAGLGRVGGTSATGALIEGLQAAESAKKADLEKAIQAALTKVTGKTFASAKEWKKWEKSNKGA